MPMGPRDDSVVANSNCGSIYKGYPIATGYMGWVPWYDRYMLFETEQEYYDYIDDDYFKEERINNERIKPNWQYGEDLGFGCNED